MKPVQNIIIELPQEDAERFESLTGIEKQVFIKFLISLLKDEKPQSKIVRDFVGYRAQRRGLTPEILEQILHEENP